MLWCTISKGLFGFDIEIWNCISTSFISEFFRWTSKASKELRIRYMAFEGPYPTGWTCRTQVNLCYGDRAGAHQTFKPQNTGSHWWHACQGEGIDSTCAATNQLRTWLFHVKNEIFFSALTVIFLMDWQLPMRYHPLPPVNRIPWACPLIRFNFTFFVLLHKE
jgi:hypothetical protein